MRITYKIIALCITLVIFSIAQTRPLPRSKELYVDFDISMKSHSEEYEKKFGHRYNKYCIEYVKNLYKKNNLKKRRAEKEPIIPKLIHQVWVGGKPVPEKYYAMMKTWRKNHKEWQHILWTDEKAQKLKMRNRQFYNQTRDPIEKANILRYEVLYKYGGLYVDIDFQCLRPFDIFHHTYDFYTGICPADCSALLNNALIGCTPRHPIINHCIKSVADDFHRRSRFERTGVMHYSRSFMNMAKRSPGITIALPPSYFYPFPKSYDSTSDTLEEHIEPQTFAVHYWANVHREGYNVIDLKSKKKKKKKQSVQSPGDINLPNIDVNLPNIDVSKDSNLQESSATPT